MTTEILDDETTNYIAQTCAYAVAAARSVMINTGRAPQPLYLFFAERDENGAPFERLRACCLAAIGYRSADEWIAHGMAVLISTHAKAIAMIAHSDVEIRPNGTQVAREAMNVFIIAAGEKDKPQGITCYQHPIERVGGTLHYAATVPLTIERVTSPLLRPLPVDDATPPDVLASSAKLVEILGRPVWLPTVFPMAVQA